MTEFVFEETRTGPHAGSSCITWSTAPTGGSHDAPNLAFLCSACHLAHHRGALTITGTADHLEVRRAAGPSAVDAHVGAPVHGNAHVDAVENGDPHVGAPTKLDTTIVRTQAKAALVRLGWKLAIAQAAVAAALQALGAAAPRERLSFEALRRCPRPTS